MFGVLTARDDLNNNDEVSFDVDSSGDCCLLCGVSRLTVGDSLSSRRLLLSVRFSDELVGDLGRGGRRDLSGLCSSWIDLRTSSTELLENPLSRSPENVFWAAGGVSWICTPLSRTISRGW